MDLSGDDALEEIGRDVGLAETVGVVSEDYENGGCDFGRDLAGVTAREGRHLRECDRKVRGIEWPGRGLVSILSVLIIACMMGENHTFCLC
jgi:hypothetical protein